MLFAAGFGTRMGPLTATLPKPMVEVAGRPLVDYALDLVRPMGFSKIVANLHYKPEALAAHLAHNDVALSYEQPDILDTGGGLRAALPLLGTGPVYTMNTDAIWQGGNPLKYLADAWQPDKMDALLLCIPPENAQGHAGSGDFVSDAGGNLLRGRGLIYSGAQIIKTDGLNSVAETAFSLNVLWDRMIERKRLFGLPYPGKWCDVGQPESIAKAEAMLREPHV